MERIPRPQWVQAEYERIGQEREAASRETERMYQWELVRVCLEMVAWTVAGLCIAAWAFHVTDRDTGLVFLWGGFLVNIGGVLVALAMAWQLGRERGDW
ncbi:MAG TPA: hypothetical protein VGD77_09075 [Gemmatimonadaceae bacterium]